jgi:hypothetical protein
MSQTDHYIFRVHLMQMHLMRKILGLLEPTYAHHLGN